MKTAVLILGALMGASTAQGAPCIDHPCYLSTNFAWDSAGVEMSGVGIWGAGAVRVDKVVFPNVPDGYAIEIIRVTGDESVRPAKWAGVPEGPAWVLIGLTTTTPYASPYATESSEGCFLYKQTPKADQGDRIDIHDDVDAVLNSDNTLMVKQALFLSEAGVSLHMEASLVVWFKYVPAAK